MSWQRVKRVAVWVVLGIGLAMRVVLLNHQTSIWYDQALYLNLADNLGQGRWAYVNPNGYNLYTLQPSGLSAATPPLYPLLISLTAALTGDLETAGRLLSLIFQFVLLLVIYRLLREWECASTALAVTAALWLSGPMVFLSAGTFAESTYLGLAAAALLMTFSPKSSSPRYGRKGAVAAGALLGLAYLTKPEAITLVPLLGLWLWRRGRLDGLAAAVALVVTILPYWIYLNTQVAPSLIPQKMAFALVLNERYPAMELDRAYFELNPECTDTLLSQRAERFSTGQLLLQSRLVRPALRQAFEHLDQNLLPTLPSPHYLQTLLFLAALAWAWKGGPGRPQLLGMIALLGLQLIPYILGRPTTDRATMSLVPAVTVVAFCAATRLVSPDRRNLVLAGLVTLWGLNGLRALPAYILDADTHRPDRVVAHWIRDWAPAGAVMARDPEIPFYARREHVLLPWDNPDRLHRYAVHRGATLLVVEVFAPSHPLYQGCPTRDLYRERPQQFRWLKTFDLPHQSFRIYQVEQSSGER